MSEREIMERQAASWCAREDRGLSAAERAALDAWLEADLSHRITFLRLKTAWQSPFVTRALQEASGTTPTRRLLPMLGYQWAAAAAVVVCIVAVAVYYLSMGQFDSFATGVGQQTAVALNDGARIELNTNTRLRTKTTGKTRVVILDMGEAYFDVRHDPGRSFVVYTGGHKITDVGTKFSIRRDGEEIEVLIADGGVRIEGKDGSREGALYAVARNDVVADSTGIRVTRKSSREIANRLSWRTGYVIFEQMTLEGAAAEFNRYNITQIRVVGDARYVRIGGRFRTNNLAGFVSLLRDSFRLEVRDSVTEIVVSQK